MRIKGITKPGQIKVKAADSGNASAVVTDRIGISGKAGGIRAVPIRIGPLRQA